MLRKLAILLAGATSLGVTVSLQAAEPDWQQARKVTVELSSFRYAPRDLRLEAGQPVLLRLENKSSGGHDFTAREFFAAATIRRADTAKIDKGSIEFDGRQTVEIALIPKAGRFPLRCGHAFHSTLGMKGSITVR